jgi:hypothetical protein
MARISGNLESFQEGMTAGHEAGRSRDLLYAVGFIAGFIWGAIEHARRSEVRAFQAAGRTA